MNYTQIPGAAIAASGATDGSLWVLSTQPSGPDKYIWHYSGGTWTNISGLASAISVGPTGTLYAINSGGGAWTYSNGTWTALGGGCSALTAASDGSLYVLSNANAAGSNQAIWHYTNGWSQIAGAGVAIAASWDPNNYTQSNGTVQAYGLYVLNSAGNIYVENVNGTFVQLPGSASAVAPTAIGGVFVLAYPANSNSNLIYYYNLNVPGWSTQPGSGVSISSGGNTLYVINAATAIYSSPIIPTVQINEYTLSSGEPQSTGPWGITAGPDKALWFTLQLGPVNCSLTCTHGPYVSVGRMTTSTGAWFYSEYTIPTPNSDPYGITAGPDGALWFTEYEAGNIGRVTTAGAFNEYAIPTANSSPWGIIAGPDGALWFTESGVRQIGRVTTSGSFTEYLIPTVNSTPQGITVGSDGALWFTEGTGSASKIGRLTTAGVFTEYPTPTANSGPMAITAGSDGALWFTETNGNKIGRLTISGTFTEYPIRTPSSSPGSIVAGPDGALWFTENGGNKIGRVTTSGVLSEYPIATNASGAITITTGTDGGLWFTEYSGNKIGQVIIY